MVNLVLGNFSFCTLPFFFKRQERQQYHICTLTDTCDVQFTKTKKVLLRLESSLSLSYHGV